jgi:hypothetical protein
MDRSRYKPTTMMDKPTTMISTALIQSAVVGRGYPEAAGDSESFLTIVRVPTRRG